MQSLFPTELWQLGGERQGLVVQPERPRLGVDTRAGCSIEPKLSLWTKVLTWPSETEAKGRKNQNPRVAEKRRQPAPYIRQPEKQTEEHSSAQRTERQSHALCLP